MVPAAVEIALRDIEDRQLQPLKDDTDALLEYFYAVWTTVRQAWADVWGRDDSTLLSKVGVVCLTMYLTDALAKVYEWGEVELTDPGQAATRTVVLLRNQERRFWMAGWKDGGLDTPAGRQQVVEDLTQLPQPAGPGCPGSRSLRQLTGRSQPASSLTPLRLTSAASPPAEPNSR